MGIKQLRRGMRYRLKTIKHRLRLQVRQLSRQGKARKYAVPPSVEQERMHPAAEAGEAPARPGGSLPTLRRHANREPIQ